VKAPIPRKDMSLDNFVITRKNRVITNVGFLAISRKWQFFIKH